MRRLYLILSLIFSVLSTVMMPHNMRNFIVTNYNLGSGLATNKIFDAAQDSLGRMWFATGYGVSLYDGYKWENLNLNSGGNTTGFKKIIIDSKGIKWLISCITTYGLKVNRGTGWTDVSIAPATNEKPEYVTGADIIYRNGKPLLVITTHDHLYILNDKKWSVTATDDHQFTDVSASRDKFYLSGRKGLVLLTFDRNGKSVLTEKVAGIDKQVLATREIAFPPAKPRLLVLASEWIGEFDGENLTRISLPTHIDFNRPFPYYFITEDKNGRVFFGNKFIKILYTKETGTMLPLRKEQGFTSDGASSVFIDRENNIWLSDFRGIDKITYHPFQNYFRSDGLLEDEVTAIIEYSPEKFVFGHNSGFTVYADGKFKPVSFHRNSEDGLLASRVLDLQKDDEGNIWAACGMFGLVRIDPQGGFTKVATGLTSVNSVLHDKDIGLIVATADNIYTLTAGKLELLIPGHHSQNYRKLFRSGHDIYAASPYGLFKVEKKSITNLIVSGDAAIKSVFSMLKESRDSILVGTEAGLYVLKSGEIYKLEKDGFSISKSIYFILRTRDGSYWFGTADGLIKWDGKTNVSEYIVQDGLAGYEMNRSAAVVDSADVFWIGTNSGLSSYPIFEAPSRVSPPRVWLASMETSSGDFLDLMHENRISHTENTLSFNFRGISFINEGLIKYRVKLEGFDEDFYEITQSQLQNIRYLNLPSGSYRLVVMAKNRFSEWSRPAYSKVILIEKPLFLQTWFILLILTVVVTAVLFGNKYFLTTREHTRLEEMVEQRTKDLAKSQKELKATLDGLEEQVRQRTEELENSNRTKDKIFSIISHDLRSPFMSILGYSELLHEDISSIDPATVEKYTGRIIEASQNTLTMIDGLLDWSKLQMGGIVPTDEKIRLQPVILEIEDLFRPQVAAKNLSLITEVDPQVNITSDPAILRTVIRNLLSNAIKFTNSGGLIKISAIQYDEMVNIQISDTGIGIPEDIIPTLFTFDTVQSRKGTANEKGTGLGLSLVHDLLEKVGGQITLQSTVGRGTVFSVSLPVERGDVFPDSEG